ncbi:TIGR03620 family F420-dependent LLM class oxidoreductase [Streptosporangium sp. NBC_01639]|uniref:TIGR03620 family F420-dependent LLM class oxidoreductase n=1 Tax=unclassified Streptosporangium TaxID=2632669 RepID=UPI002DD9CBD2|nr:TIGR03620 family F420-dependent LLM class oxidoreductase [Streptosporangium sp. NBC_01756]WSC86176.1 TIGR03620 family F420-dependent LLM class oxidoreductase [Streptosporangium sp. NBC_01756]WTD55135.1 TIGR03620 family F420-dependent LLM class oxidoreductase [Streptosporangium sp. NBC_01639]
MSGQGPDLGRIGVWAGGLDDYPMAGVRDAAAAIEDAGYGTLWFPETTGREAMAQAGVLLSATRRIVVAAGAADIYARDAVTAAAGQRTLDEAFPGRFLLGLWESHPSLAEDVRGHRFGPPPETMRGYLDAMDAAPSVSPSPMPRRVLAALGAEMLELAGERTWGAHPLGMPVQHTRNARAVLGPEALLAVTQLVILDPDRSNSAELARSFAAALLPNRRALLHDLGFEEVDSLDDRLVDALVVRGSTDDIAYRVGEHLEAGADHVSLYVLTATPRTPPIRQWRELAGVAVRWQDGADHSKFTPGTTNRYSP